MASVKYICSIESLSQGPGNEAILDFDFLTPLPVTEAAVLAQIVAYIASVGDMAVGTSIASIRKRASGSSGSTPVAFPVTEYAALKAILGSLPAMAGYGTSFGSGALTAIGSSILVNEYTAIPSRATRGRHYRPWMNVGAVDASGEVAVGFRTGVVGAYRALLLGDTTTGTVWDAIALNCQPVVHSATAGDTLIQNVTVSTNVARLKSRTR